MNNLKIHQEKYPHRTIQDDLKFLFQSVLGCEHFVLDEKRSLERIESEMEGEASYFIEDLNDDFCRFHYGKLTKTQSIVLNQLFIASSKVHLHNKDQLRELLNQLGNDVFVADYIKQGMPPISHSDYFKQHYHPHYRVIYKHYVIYFELLCDIYEKGFHVLGIDGRCGSGKSTLGKLISEIYNCPLIHMDDFYLPQSMRTQERFEEPGGNVHYERFKQEVHEAILKGEDFKYGVFTHRVMDVDYYKEVKKNDKYVIEGSYSFHPELRDYIDYKVLLTQTSENQKKRILKRDGEEVWKMFETRWIPLEELYFSNYDLSKIATKIVDVTERER